MDYTPEIDPSALGGKPSAPTSSSLAYTPDIPPDSVGAKYSDDNLFDALILQESSGRQLDNAGRPVTSKRGAIGRAQVMPGTAPEAAALAGLPYDEIKYRTDAAYNTAIGRAYFNKQMADFGRDPAKAFAAYNAGPGALNNAMRAAQKQGQPDAWLQFLPRETRDYVPAIMARLSGIKPGSAQQPTSQAAPATAPRSEFTETGRSYGAALRPPVSPTLGDYGKELAASAVDSFGHVGRFVGDIAAAGANAVTGTSAYEGKNLLTPAVDSIRGSMTEGGKEARAGAEIKGDFVDALKGDWSNITVPDNFSSWLMIGMNGLGSLAGTMVPIVGPTMRAAKLAAAGDMVGAAAAARAAKVIGASAGAAVTGGAAAGEVRDNVRKMMSGMTHEQLMKDVPAYAEEFAKTGDQKESRSRVENAAAQWAGGAAAVFGAAGGVLNAKLIEDFLMKKGVSAALGKSSQSLAGRTGIGTVGVGMVEGLQEGSEKVGQNVGENIGLGKPAFENATRDTLGDVVGGAMVGGVTGGAGGAISRPHVEEQATKPNSPLSRAAMKAPETPALGFAGAGPGDGMQGPLTKREIAQRDVFDRLWGTPPPDPPAPPRPELLNEPQTEADVSAPPLPPLPPQLNQPRAEKSDADPTANARLGYAASIAEEKALGGDPAQARVADAMRAIEQRGGVASPQEAAIIDAANIGKPYDRIDQALDARTPQERIEQAAGGGVGQPLSLSPERAAIRAKRKAHLAELANNGFDGVEKTADGFVFNNTKTGQSLKLDSAADAALARNAVNSVIKSLAAEANHDPTDGQKEAGNYKKPPVPFGGMTIRIENAVGSVRTGSLPGGGKWTTPMRQAHYGYIEGTAGADGDGVDVYLVDNPSPKAPAFVIDQYNEDGTFDETKTILGARNEAQALRVYDAGFSDGSGPSRRRAVTEMPIDAFKAWAFSDAAKRPAGSDLGVTVSIDGQRRRLALLSPNSKQANSLRAIAGLFGKDVKFFDSSENIGDGFVIPGDDSTIYIGHKSDIDPLAVLGHELMHLFKRDNPEAFAAIEAIVRSKLTGGALEAFDAYTRGQYSKEESIEEITADLGGNFMTDPQFWREVFDRIAKDNGEKSTGIIARLVAAVNAIVDSLKTAGRKYVTDKLISDIAPVRAAVRDGLADYIAAHGIKKGVMQAEVLRSRKSAQLSLERRSDSGLQDVLSESRQSIRTGAEPNAKAAPAEKPKESVRAAVQPADASPKVGIHFSLEPRSRVDGRYYGRGLKGSERARLESATDPRLKDRSYFYIDEGGGVRPEAGVGGYAHEVDLPRLYDAKANPEKLWNSGDINATESAILDAGYHGYFVKKHETGQGLAVVIGPASHSMPARQVKPSLISGSQEPVATSVRAALMSSEIRAIDTSKIPGAKVAAGTLTFPMDSREQANAEMERIGSPVRFSKPRIMTTADERAEIEKKYKGTALWMKAPNGEPTKLNERQWVHVRTNSFKAWFGDWEKAANGRDGNGVWDFDDVSKVVDSNGEPLVVYHGTDSAGFSEFKRVSGDGRGNYGVFTTDNRDMAATYVRMRRNPQDVTLSGDGEFVAEPSIYRLFMNIRNPDETHFEGANWDGDRTGQYRVIIGEDEEPVYDENGNGYFRSKAEAQEVADKHPGAEVEPAEDHYESTDSVVKAAWRLKGTDGAIIRQVSDDGGAAGRYAGEPSDIFVALYPGQVKSADFNDGQYSVSDDDIRRSATRTEADVKKIIGGLSRHLSESERAGLNRGTAQKLVDQFKALPSVDEFAAVAAAGQAKRGWYRESAKAISAVFGPDAPRFAGLLAAMSPQVSVEINLSNALGTWVNWVNSGRPQTRPAIVEAMRNGIFGGNKLTDSILPAWIPNSVRALTTPDPDTIVLSGPKVNSFMANLRGDVNEVTNDAWMANFALVDQTMFKGNLNGNGPGKGPGYLAMSARVRAAAKRLTELTGDTWTPAEVQETVWSWAKTLYELQNKDFGAVEILQYDQITDELIAATPDFKGQLLEESNKNTLANAGYDVAAAIGADTASAAASPVAKPTKKARPFDSDTQRRLETRAARRLEKLRLNRLAESNARAMDGISFSRARLSDFTPTGIDNILNTSDWVIMTAENPDNKPASKEANERAMDSLLNDLMRVSSGVEEVVGRYGGGDERSYLAVGVSEAVAQRLGAKYGQEAVLVPKGMLYRDDSFHPALGVETFADPPDDYFTRIGDMTFRINIDFENKVHHHEERPVKYEGHMGDGSSVQKHSAGVLYPYVLAARDAKDGNGYEYGLIGGKLRDYEWVGSFDAAVDRALALKGGDAKKSVKRDAGKTTPETREALSRLSVLRKIKECLK